MAVNIDTVYQRVLAIANKEQRGYVTPQEFNLYANQAQMDIFEQYFYDLNQFGRMPGNDTTYADMIDLLNEKIDLFERYREQLVLPNSGSMSGNQPGMGTLPLYYRMGELYHKHRGGYIEIEKINQNEVHHIQNSPLTAPNLMRPVYVRIAGITPNAANNSAQTATTQNEINRSRSIQVYPTTISTVYCNYIARPVTVEWAYTTVLDEALYNANNSQDFELHISEETELVIKILELAGVEIKDPQLYQVAATEEAQNVQQEKQ